MSATSNFCCIFIMTRIIELRWHLNVPLIDNRYTIFYLRNLMTVIIFFRTKFLCTFLSELVICLVDVAHLDIWIISNGETFLTISAQYIFPTFINVCQYTMTFKMFLYKQWYYDGIILRVFCRF